MYPYMRDEKVISHSFFPLGSRGKCSSVMEIWSKLYHLTISVWQLLVSGLWWLCQLLFKLKGSLCSTASLCSSTSNESTPSREIWRAANVSMNIANIQEETLKFCMLHFFCVCWWFLGKNENTSFSGIFQKKIKYQKNNLDTWLNIEPNSN